MRRRDPDVEHGYREEVYFNPLIVAANRIFRGIEAPQVAASILPRTLRPSPRIRTELESRQVILLEHPNYFDMVSSYLRKDHVLVLDAHNIEYKMYERVLQDRSILGMVARHLYALEKRCFTAATLVFTCSSEDRDIAIREFGTNPSAIHVAPNGVDLASTPFVTDAEREKAKERLGLEGLTALFVGSRWPPNSEAAAEIIKMAPARPDITYLIVGAAGDAFVEKHPPNVMVTGAVDDLRPYVAASDVAINPVVSGSGSNVKVFEYLAAGLPTVSTPFGARGVDDPDGQAVTTCEIDAFPDQLIAIVNSPDLKARRIAARKLVEKKYDWTAIAARISDAIIEHVRSRTG